MPGALNSHPTASAIGVNFGLAGNEVIAFSVAAALGRSSCSSAPAWGLLLSRAASFGALAKVCCAISRAMRCLNSGEKRATTSGVVL